jgi:hypothetical protein
MAIAILFGISERFLDRVVTLAEHGIVPGIDATEEASAEPPGAEPLRPAFGT